MHLRTLAFSVTGIFLAPIAHAQAPGDSGARVVVATPAGTAPSTTSAVAPAVGAAAQCADCREPVMANRWSLGVSIGSLGLAPNGSPDRRDDFLVGELALRFRATPHLELEVASEGGQQAHDHRDDYLQMNTVMLAARYRFLPEAAWNWFVMGGVGAAAIASHDATDEERRNAIQPLGMLGIGVERRFAHFALQAEARGVGLGKRTETTTAASAAMATPVAMPTMTTTEPARSGGSFSIGLSYYF